MQDPIQALVVTAAIVASIYTLYTLYKNQP